MGAENNAGITTHQSQCAQHARKQHTAVQAMRMGDIRTPQPAFYELQALHASGYSSRPLSSQNRLTSSAARSAARSRAASSMAAATWRTSQDVFLNYCRACECKQQVSCLQISDRVGMGHAFHGAHPLTHGPLWFQGCTGQQQTPKQILHMDKAAALCAHLCGSLLPGLVG